MPVAASVDISVNMSAAVEQWTWEQTEQNEQKVPLNLEEVFEDSKVAICCKYFCRQFVEHLLKSAKCNCDLRLHPFVFW